MSEHYLPFPVFGAAYRLVFPIVDTDGKLVTGAEADTPDSEISRSGGALTDCTNEIAAIGQGIYYLDLTFAEMEADVVALIVKTATAGTCTFYSILHPRRMTHFFGGTAQAGSDNSITLNAGDTTKDGGYEGMYVITTNNDPAGVEGQARFIHSYNGASKIANTNPSWRTNPTAATAYSIRSTLPADLARLQHILGAGESIIEDESTKSLVAHNLDHLAKTATAGADMTTEVADNTILSRMLANGDTAAFVPSTDGLQPLRDELAAGVTLADDAITAAKFDESTAFPVKAADAGPTQIARVALDIGVAKFLLDG